MWWLFWSIEQNFKEQNARIDRLEARVDTIETQLREIAVCLKAIADKLH